MKHSATLSQSHLKQMLTTYRGPQSLVICALVSRSQPRIHAQQLDSHSMTLFGISSGSDDRHNHMLMKQRTRVCVVGDQAD